MLQNFPVLIPPFPEQHSISSFLNSENARIDALIAKKELQIELLQEKRVALISYVVTKGLDPNVKMRDSGIDWIGEVPEHWEVRRLHRVLLRVVKKNRDCNDRKMISLSAKRGLVYKEYDHQIQIRPKEENLEYVIVKPNQLVVNPMWIIESGLGVSFLDGIVSPAYRVYNINKMLIPLYLHYLVKTPRYISQYFRYIRGLTTYDRSVREEDFYSIEIILPPKKEQNEIIEFIQQNTSKHDQLIRKIEESIIKLKEYRTALVSAAVTGKIDVREEVHA
jgi:type I restriction enzyme, S subunit